MMSNNNTKKRILIFSTAYHPFVGGAEVAVKEITDRLGDFIDFDLITARLDKKLPKYEKVGKIGVYRIGSGRPFLDKISLPILGAIKASKLQKTGKYGCFWGIMASYAPLAGYTYNLWRVLTGRRRIPVILTLQEGDSETHLKYKWLGLISLSWKLSLRNTDVLTAISNFLLHRAQKNGFKGKEFLVPNGVDVSLFSQNIFEAVKTDLKNKLGKKEGDIFLVTTSRLSYKNAIDDVIRSLSYLPNNISFIIIGKGDEGPKLQKLADSLGIANRVKFLGFIPYDKIPEYLSICDIFVRPSRSEGFGNSFIEAMSARIPVIATPVGGIVDFISDRETGFFATVDNPKSIATVVNDILSNPTLKNSVIENAYKKVCEKYDWSYVSEQMKKVFDTVL